MRTHSVPRQWRSALQRGIAGAAAAALFTGALAACSNNDAGSGGGNAASADGLAAAQELVAESAHLDESKIPMPTEPVKRQKVRVFMVSPNAANPYSTFMMDSFTEAAKVMGWELSPMYDAASTATKGAAFIRQAIQEGYDAIYYPSIQGNALKAPIQEALDAGLVIAAPDAFADPSLGDRFITPTQDSSELGRRLAAYAITLVNGQGTILTYPDPEYPHITQRFEGFDKYIKDNCPGCTLQPTQFTAASLAQPGPPVWTSALSTNPPGAVDLAVAPFALASRIFAQTQESRGRDDIKIIDTGNIDGQQADMLSSGKLPYLGASVALEQYEAWASADLIARVVAGQETYDVNSLPTMLATPDNAHEFLTGSAEPKLDYKSKFTELWQQTD